VKFGIAVLILTLGLLLTACSPAEPQAKARFAAKVNGEEISVPRFRFTRARAEAQNPGQSIDPARLVDDLIEQTLFAQKAGELELHRKGLVPAALEDARAAVLARAYIERLASRAPDLAEIGRFYDEHAQLFKERRIFRVFELAVVAPPERIAALTTRAKRATGLQPIAEWLTAEGVPYNVGGVTKSSEQLAPQLLGALKGMRDGEVRVLRTAGGASVLQLVRSEPAPLSRDAAAPTIEALLRARHMKEVVARESKFLRSRAAIEYGVELTASAPPAAGE
jgi:EpsD family peptidyl-prolyl cis-trans isomerase